jgi:hypothetical protein
MAGVDFYELDIVDIASEIAREITGVISVSLFGSRKYPGKIRSDLDLLVTGPLNMGALTYFREKFQHYGPLDLWLAVGETAASVVNGSVLPVNELRKIELYPDHSRLPVDLKKQRFRSDIEYQMTIVTPGTYVPIRGDRLGVTRRCPLLLDGNIDQSAEAVVRILENAIEAVRRMRHDGIAKRGKGTQISIRTEYDLQNLTEMVLSPFMALQREPFTIKCQGVRRAADFALAGGRLILELKMARNSSEVASVIKDAKGVLSCYLDHPGTEIALAVLAIASSVHTEKNSIESWAEVRGSRHAVMRVVNLPIDLLD